jgi:hypothetical protein
MASWAKPPSARNAMKPADLRSTAATAPFVSVESACKSSVVVAVEVEVAPDAAITLVAIVTVAVGFALVLH